MSYEMTRVEAYLHIAYMHNVDVQSQNPTGQGRGDCNAYIETLMNITKEKNTPFNNGRNNKFKPSD